MNIKRKPAVGFDMDGVITNYYKGFFDKFVIKFPKEPFIIPEELKTFYIEDSYGERYKSHITDITRSVDFFRTLEPITGAIEALKKIINDTDIEPFICSAPDLDSVGQTSWTGKGQWIEHFLGRDWLKRTILTKDKTVVGLDYLIDDKPVITGLKQDNPFWRRIVFDQPYNQDVNDLRMHGWEDWDNIKAMILHGY